MEEVTERIRVLMDFEADRAEKAAKRMERQLGSLESRYDPLSRAAKRLDRDQELLNKAFAAGTIDMAKHARLLEEVQREYDQTAQKATALGGALDRNAVSTSGLTGVMGRNRAVFQQAGYQVGDFAVQVQGGTSAVTAFTQQGSQLLGVFGAYGAIAGAALAVTVPLAAGLLGASGSAATLEDSLSDLKDISDTLDDSFDQLSLSTDDLNQKYTIGAAAARELIQAQAELRVSTANEALREQVNLLADAATGYYTASDAGRNYRNTIARIKDEFGVTADEAKRLEEAIQETATAGTVDGQIEALRALNGLMAQYGVAAENIPPELAAALDELTSLTLATDEARALMVRVTEAAVETSEATEATTAEAVRLSMAVDSINFSTALTGAQRLSQQLNVSLQQAMQMMGLLGAAAQAANAAVVYDPRDPRYDADAAEQASKLERLKKIMGDLDEETKRVSASTKSYTGEVNAAAAAVGGGGGSGGGSRGGLAGSTRAATEAAKDFEKTQEAVKKILRGAAEEAERTAAANRELAASWAETFTDAAISGDLTSAFERLGRDSRAAFFDALGEGRSIGDIMSGGMGDFRAGLSSAMGAGTLGGTLGGIGQAITGAMPILGAISTGIGLIQGLIGSTQTLDAGLRLSVEGFETAVEKYSTEQRTALFGLINKTSTKYSAADAETQTALGEAVSSIQRGTMETARSLGVGARAFADFSHEIELSTEGMSRSEAIEALEAELTGLGNEFAGMVPHIARLGREGETATDTLARLSGDLGTFNSALGGLLLEGLPASLRSARRASLAMQSAGGAGAFAAGAGVLFDDMTAADQMASLRRQITGQLRGAGLTDVDFAQISSVDGLRGDIESNQGNVRRVGALTGIAPLVQEYENLAEARKSETASARDRVAEIMQSARIERLGQREQIAELRGHTREANRLNLAAFRLEIEGMDDRARAAEWASRKLSQLVEDERNLAAERERLAGSMSSLRKTTRGLRIDLAEARGFDDYADKLRGLADDRYLDSFTTEAERAQAARNLALEKEIDLLGETADTIDRVTSSLSDYPFASFYDERRATLDAMAGREWKASYRAPQLGAPRTAESDNAKMLKLLEQILEQSQITSSASMKNSAASQRMEEGIKIQVARSV